MAVSNSASAEANVSSADQQLAPPPTATKKKRNLPGMPDPDAEVIALSPKTLLATNRFVCEVCNKGFQRDQNLQLHRRGHNLPWKLRQRSGKEVRKRVYVCPEPSCLHHDPSRALGDLTGIKKHFCRKHGEKKFKCEKCSKMYAVQSDWKAHSKTCGTREYRCDCGTLFSRKDSFITHRAFCEALAEENNKVQTTVLEAATVENPRTPDVEPGIVTVASSSSSPSSAVVATALPPQEQTPQELENTESAAVLQPAPPPSPPVVAESNGDDRGGGGGGGGGSSNSTSSAGTPSTSTSLFASLFASAGASVTQNSTFSDLTSAVSRADGKAPLSASAAELTPLLEPPSLCLFHTSTTLFSAPLDRRPLSATPPSAHLSATALLQKAAQMGPAATNPSLLLGFGLAPTTSNYAGHRENPRESHHQQARHHPEHEQRALSSAGLGLGLPYEYDGSGDGRALSLTTPPPLPFLAPKPATLDLLGLGMGPGAPGAGGLSALITSMGSVGGYEMDAASPAAFGLGRAPANAWEGADRAPGRSAFL